MTEAATRGDPVATALWNAQVALANMLTRFPGMEGDLKPVIAYVGPPPGWVAGDGWIDPETRPPDVAPESEMAAIAKEDKERLNPKHPSTEDYGP